MQIEWWCITKDPDNFRSITAAKTRQLYPVKYFTACTPEDEIVQKCEIKGGGWKKQMTEVACHCSHVSVINKLIGSDLDAIIVLEDDGILNHLNHIVVPFIQTFDSSKFDYVQLFAVNSHFDKSSDYNFDGTQQLEWKHVNVPQWGMYGYIITKNIAEKIQGIINLQEISTPIDNAFVMLSKKGLIRSGMLNYNLVIHDDQVPSTIR